MRYLDINLATDPIRNHTLYYWTYGILSAGVLLFLTYNVYSFARYSGELSRMKERRREARIRLAEIQGLERDLRKQAAGWDFEVLSSQAVFAGDAILRRSFSWTKLFNQLEQVVPAQVMMVSIRPNITAAGITVRVDGIAKNHFAFLEFQENLQSSPFFRHVYPGGERREETRRIFFNLTFDYHPSPEAAPEPLPQLAQVVPAAPGKETEGEPADSGLADAPATGPGGVAEAAPEPAGGKPVEPRKGQEGKPGPSPPSPAGAAAGSPPPGPGGGRPEDAPSGRGEVEEPAPEGAPPSRGLTLSKVDANGRLHTMALTLDGVAPPKPPPPVEEEKPTSFHLFLQGETVSEAYRRLARLGKVTIVLQEGLNPGRRITARIRANTFEEALGKVAEKVGHRYWKEGEGIYRIGDASDPGFPGESGEVREADLEESPGPAGPPEEGEED